MSKIQNFTALVCMLTVANAWGAGFIDDFNRPDGDVGNGWTIQADGTIEVKIVDNEVLIEGQQATDWTRSGLSRAVENETRISFDFKADNSFNVHIRIDDAETIAYIDVYAWPGGPFSYASSEDGGWPGWTEIAGSNMVAGEYNTLVLEQEGTEFTVTLNGGVVGTVTNNKLARIGSVLISSDAAAGTVGSLHIDNVQIGVIIAGMAKDPSPVHNATSVPRDVVVGWAPGVFAATHDVYFGTVFTDVNDASRTNSLNVLVSQGQTATAYDPAGLLEFGQTYYWRIDEVNAPPDPTIYKGDVWSFTTYAIENIEDFETGDFSKFPWEHFGDKSWAVTSRQKHSGAYSAQAGIIGDDESTALQVTLDCVSGDILFYCKVSSEPGFVYLKFYIDGVEKGRWSVEQDWADVSFPVTAGRRTFKWTYSNYGSESESEDTVWIDDIVFPPQLNHPFLILTESDYPALRALAEQSPWSRMKADAINGVQQLVYSWPDSYKAKARRLGDVVSAGALAYILDPADRSTYISKVYDTMVTHWPELRAGLDGSENTHTVHPGGAFFRSVLALDIMYNGLTDAQRADIEGQLQLVADWYNSTNTEWRLNLYGCRGIWALYKDDRSGIDKAKRYYRNELFSQLTDDGVFNSSMSYAGQRLGQTRFAKSHFVDVLEFTGEDNSYYSDSTVQAFMEWLYGYSTTPFRLYYTFGDAWPTGDYHRTGPGQYRVHRFSAAAEKYAAWNNNGWTAPGRLLYYIFMTKPFPQPQRAPSRIFPDGGAWFVEAGNSDRALAGALWNCRSVSAHAHKDVDAIHLAAYGEHVLRNSGYAGWGEGAFGYTWDYVHDYAESSNTLLIDGADHVAKVGAGIAEGFTAPYFDYASGDSGKSLSGGRHQRNFVFIHPRDRISGYWILFDEARADRQSSLVNIVLHPNSNDCTTVSPDTEYEWNIGPYIRSGHHVYLSIFLGTAPISTSVKDGLLASGGGKSFVGRYLYSTYDTDRNGSCNIVTVLFPHDNAHNKAEMTRISAGDYTGASIALSRSIEDIALESAGTGVVTYNGVSFTGLAAWYRLKRGLLTSYFVRKGQSLCDGLMPRVGFEALDDVSIYLDGTAGRIVSPDTLVTFYYPGIVGVFLGGSPLSNISSGTDWVQVDIPSGTHEIEFELHHRVSWNPNPAMSRH